MEILFFGVWCRPFYNYWSVPPESCTLDLTPSMSLNFRLSDLFAISLFSSMNSKIN